MSKPLRPIFARQEFRPFHPFVLKFRLQLGLGNKKYQLVLLQSDQNQMSPINGNGPIKNLYNFWVSTVKSRVKCKFIVRVKFRVRVRFGIVFKVRLWFPL